MPNKISYANYTFDCSSTNPNLQTDADGNPRKFTYPVGPFWPAATSGDDI